MANLRISDLTTATSVNDTDLVEISQVDGNSSSGYATKKTTILAIAIKILKGISFSDLATTSKQIINAINELKNGKVDTSQIGTAGGVAELDSSGHVPASQLPSSVDDIVEGYYYNGKFYEEDTHQTEIPAEAGKIYIDLTTNNTYRWGGSVYVEISPSLSLGETSTTAYRGDRGKVAYDHATESGRETTGVDQGLYKFSVTPEGHIGAGPTAATKSDFTAMGLLGEIDDALSSTSENPVKNNALYTAFQGKENVSDMENDVTDIVVGLTDTQTATGNPVTLTTEQAGGAKSCEVSFSPIQSGSGNPSPENVRPISGWTEVTVKQSDTEIVDSIVSPKTIYSFHIDGAESDPSNKITYLGTNASFTPAYMDYTNDRFIWGSWENAFFLPRPCMLTKDGSVAYYLDPNDYTKKLDGTVSDIADDSTELNAMMEWGRNGQKIWYKIAPDSGDDTSATVYIANYQVDSDYVDYAFHNYQGVSGNHFYTPIYNGSLDSNNKLRSISGKQVMASKTATNEVTYAENNNPANTPIWNIEQYCDIVLITLLLWLMGKSTNTQDVFGNGISSGSQAGCEAYRTGALNDKGMFYGKDGSVNTTTAVKVFGMENFWGLQWRRYQGHLLIGGSQYVKMTYGQEDGSTADGFSLAGTGYINKGHQPTGTSGQYLKTQEYDSIGFYPKNANNTDASVTKYYCDGLWFNNDGTLVPVRGGTSSGGAIAGASAVRLNTDASYASWNVGASLSCKPLSKTTDYTSTLGATYYGGKLDIVSGKLTIDRIGIHLTDGNSWTQYQSANKYYIDGVFNADISENLTPISSIELFGSFVTEIGYATTDKKFYIQKNVGRIIVYDSSLTFAQFKDLIDSRGMDVVLYLATPQEITLTPKEIELLKGQNVLWTDGDSVLIKYAKLPNGNLGALVDYIQKLEARVKALEEA